jgi:DNA-binding beta-propeller fold protein YncE
MKKEERRKKKEENAFPTLSQIPIVISPLLPSPFSLLSSLFSPRSSFFLFSFFFFLFFSLYAEPTNYTYNYDYWLEQVSSPDAYRVSDYILGTNLEVGHFRDPQGLFIRDNRIYICDSGNNRIIKIEVDENGKHTVKANVSSVIINGEESPFNNPMDIFENRDGNLYIADTNNKRVLVLDNNWKYIHTIVKPEDESIGELTEFLPVKLIVDFANRVFIQARNINKGLMEFDSRWEFSGYMGANKVTVNPIDYIWKLISTKAQKERMNLFIPTEYSNIAIDKDGFIYVTNSMGQTDPIRRLNAMGQDILIRNGYEDPIGDLAVGNAGGISGRSRFIDVVAFNNDSYACFDRARGRIFMYDFQGNMLYAFGGVGNRKGSFQQPVALDKMGYSLYALDSRAATLTRFDLTDYGALINEALNEYKAGRYESSAVVWEKVLKMNGNYDLAYIGIGRAALREKEFQKAMKYYKLKHYREGYGKAFQLYRKQWMEENLWWMLLIIGIAVFLPPVIRFSIKTIKEIKEA